MAKSRFLLAILGALSWACIAGPAQAGKLHAPEPVAFSIDAGTLDAALEAVARQSRMQILYAPGLVVGIRSGGLQGELPPAEALRRLLRGTGLQAEIVNDGTFLVRRGQPTPPTRVATMAAPNPEPRTEPLQMLPVQVTGSRIPRSHLDVVTPSPVSLISREEIQSSGHQTLFELLRYQPGMVGHHPVDVAADGGQGVQQPFATAATTSLNALGPRATLFLVDGRRLATYGLISADLGGLADLDAIPLSMVERVEILRGGASAIYGADAMAGVVNIILRKQQEGSELVARYGRSSRGDAGEHRVSLSHGMGTRAGGSAFAAADYLQRDALLGDRRRWRTMDHRRHGLGDWRVPLGYRDDEGVLVQPACNPGPGAPVRSCLLDIPRFLTLQPATERLSLYGHLRQPLRGTLDWSADVRVSQAHQRLQGAPFYGRINLPDAHPDARPDADRLDYAFFDIGPVRNSSDTRTVDLATGLAGLWGRWEWAAAASRHQNRVTSRISGLVRDTTFGEALEEASYRFGVTDNPGAVLASISPVVTARGTATLDQVTFATNGPGPTLPAGPVRMAAGIEVGRDALRHRPDALMLEQDLALSPQKITVDNHRYGSSIHVESAVPLHRRLHADLAMRLDHRQGYGSERSPKVGLKWNAHESLTLRGTWATGYRAPSLFELRRPYVYDELALVLESETVAPCAVTLRSAGGTRLCLVELGSRENPDLRPETSRSHTIGLVWSPSADAGLSLDHFRIQRRNEILPGSALDDLKAFPMSLQRDAQGRLVGIDQYFENVGLSDVRGWELEARYGVDTARAGRFDLQLSAHYLERLERRARSDADVLDQAGRGAPDRTALASLQWSYSDWRTSLNVRGAGAAEVAAAGRPCPVINRQADRCTTPGSAIVDLDVQYSGVPGWVLGFNASDVGDRRPVNFDVTKGGYDIARDDARGRYFRFSAAYRF